MRQIQKLLQVGVRHFNSGTSNSPEFIEFFDMFCKAFRREFNKVGATEYKFNRGHFYLSGFFKVQEQIYYFSISDVRHGLHQANYKGEIKMLIRTAKGFEDYTGGANRYITIEPNMTKDFLRMFGLDSELFKEKKPTKKSVEQYADEIISRDGEHSFNVGSAKKAMSICFLVGRKLGKSVTVTEKKYGRIIHSCTSDFEIEGKRYHFYYSGHSKRMTMEVEVIS